MTSDTQQQRFILSATVDFPDDVRYGVYNLDRLEEIMVKLSPNPPREGVGLAS